MDKSRQQINIALFYTFNILNNLLTECFQKDNTKIDVHFRLFKNLRALMQEMEAQRFDLVIIDLGTWFDLTNNQNLFRRRTADTTGGHACNVLLIMQESGTHVIDQLVKMDIDAIISMSDGSSELKQAIEHVFNPEIKHKYISGYIIEQLSSGQHQRLSKKEWEVVKMFSEGYSLIEIAEKRCRAISTVATQKANAMKKLNLQNNGELIKYFYIHSLF